MSMSEDEARYEEWMDQLYREHKEQAIEEFATDRLRSFYLQNPSLLKRPVDALQEARKLLGNHVVAAQVFAAIAAELGLKVALLKPVVHGLVHSDSTAEMIADLALRHSRFDFFRNLLSQILADHGGLDLNTHMRPGATKILRVEIEEIQKCRDHIVHRGDSATRAQAEQAIAVAEAIVEVLVPAVISHLHLHLHDGTVYGAKF